MSQLDLSIVGISALAASIAVVFEVLLSQLFLPKIMTETYVATFIGIFVLTYIVWMQMFELSKWVALVIFVIWKFLFWIFGSAIGISQLATLPAPTGLAGSLITLGVIWMMLYAAQFVLSFYGSKMLTRR